jgi:hypothetical protein
MSSALRTGRVRSPLRRGPVGPVAALGCALAIAITFTLTGTQTDDRQEPRPRADAGALTAMEQAAVVGALSGGDARQHRIASQVAAAQAGASALADPAILHHHGVDTSRRPARPTGEVGAERFHHR